MRSGGRRPRLARRRRAGLGLALLASLVAATVTPSAAQEVLTAEVSSRPIRQFLIGSDQSRFGPLEFVGGLEMVSPQGAFGALSAFRFLEPGGRFLAVTDTGFWLFGTITRDAAGLPTGMDDVRLMPILDAEGEAVHRKSQADAEGLDVKDGIATVGFERNHRVLQYRIDPQRMGPPLRSLDFLIPKRELRQNRGFETVTRAHADGQHEGGLVVVTEKSLDKAGNQFAAIIEGRAKGIFTVRRDGDFDITDGAFLPDGDLLLLERSYGIMQGVKMRLRRIHGESVARGQVADGPVILDADMGYQIDNMEGLDVWQRADGATMVSMVSDDNHSILQRSVYLEFVLHAE